MVKWPVEVVEHPLLCLWTNVTVRSRSRPTGVDGDITYTLEKTKLYKGAFDDGDEISFITAGQIDACGTYLEVDGRTKYLMGLHLTNGMYTADICGLDEPLESITDEDMASVKTGCADTLCDVDCSEFQFRRTTKRMQSRKLSTAYLVHVRCRFY